MVGALIAAAILPKSGNSHALPICIAVAYWLGAVVVLRKPIFAADPTK